MILVRGTVRRFTGKQVELIEAFADQAVIAIENTRLLNELRESLQQQTATADVLKVISRSTFDLRAVLDTLVESARQLCEATTGTIFLPKDGAFYLAASCGIDPEYRDRFTRIPMLSDRATVTGRVLLEGRPIHIPDIQADPDYKFAPTRDSGRRTMLGVPLLREGNPIGVFILTHSEVRPFTEKQVELVETFADQAVIAIENVRLFDEVQARTRDLSEALEQQTATSEVLGAISSSAGELKPVFETMLANATRICEANFGNLLLLEGEEFRHVALHGAPLAYLEERRRVPTIRPRPGAILDQLLKTKQVVHVVDVLAEGGADTGAIVRLAGARTFLNVPMLKDGELIGVLAIYRQEVRAFTDKQIELVKNFAAQAVIAIENTRLLNELRESLQQQTATADVLKVISRSTFDLQSVLDTLAESAVRLCDSDRSVIRRRVGDSYPVAATYGFSPEQRAFREQYSTTPNTGSIFGRTLLEGRTVHIPDVEAAHIANVAGVRAGLGVPLKREGNVIGLLTVVRSEPRAFTKKQIELVETFADQAVIAIENVRLFDEIQDKSRQLQLASENKSAFVSSMSHELRTPLNAIIGLTEMVIGNAERFGADKAKEPLTPCTAPVPTCWG